MDVEVGGFEVTEAPAGAASIPVLQENGVAVAGVNGPIKFGSHGDDPAKEEASNVSGGRKDAVDEWPAPRQVHSFYFIRYRPYDDVKLKAKKELIEKEVEKKTHMRFQITDKIRAKKSDRGEIISQLKALGAEDKQYWAIIDEKRKEMAPLQQALGQLRNPNGGGVRGGDKGGLCSSEEELDAVIRSLNYRMQHESIPLSEEKQILKEIKALEQTRPQVVANAAKRAEIQGSMGQKETIQGQVKSIGGDLDGVRKEKQVIREKIKELEKQLNDLNQAINKLETERQTISETRDKAYETRQQLNKQRNDGNANFYVNRSLLNTARELASKRDVKALEELANIEIEKFMAQWNNEKAFREDYEKRIISSLDNRFLSRDGRMRNPEEKPLVAVEASTPAATESIAKAGVKKVKEDVKETLTQASQKTKEETKAKGEGKAKPAEAEVSKEPVAPNNEDNDIFVAPKVVSKAIEIDPEKLKEQKRQEEIAKAKQAAERKKKLAEKAVAKAAIKAQKEAEKKLKDKEKKAKKKAGASVTSNAEMEEPTQTAEDAASAEQEEDKTVEETAPVSTKTRQPKNAVRQKIRSKGTAPLPKAILKRKKATNYWQWAAPAGAIVVVLLLALTYYYYLV